ncbi:MAG: SLC13 family permease [Gammaproteobacteria bacterium]
MLSASMIMFIWGRWRHDMVAMGALLACVFLDLVEGAEAFAGFGHPAVITVACVLIMGYGLQLSGAVDLVAYRILPSSAGPVLTIMTITSLAGFLSGFMNNAGALALLMPLALRTAAKRGLPPGRILMPLSFGSILGGITTLIGTPPNLIVSEFRAEAGMGYFAIFDFTPVGLTVAVTGILFIGLIGWKLVPVRQKEGAAGFESGNYLSEVRIVEDSKAAGKMVREVDFLLVEADAQIVGLIRGGFHIIAPNPRVVLRVGDILVIEVEPLSLNAVLSRLGVRLEGDMLLESEKEMEGVSGDGNNEKSLKTAEVEGGADGKAAMEAIRTGEIVIKELVASPGAALIDRTVSDMELRSIYGINLLAISRQGQHSIKRLQSTRIQAGDVLLLQGTPESISAFATGFGCLPLAWRDIRVPKPGQAIGGTVIMTAAVGLAAFGVLPTAVAFATGALALLAVGVVPIRSAYRAVDWPVIVLLAAMLPVADAMQSTGAADMVARILLNHVARGHAVAGLIVILLITMFLSDVMNNAATAAVMCPIAIGVSHQLGVNTDTFLMAVAIGSSCAFLTPIGHQNNTLILGPSGFRFGDYWRLGLPVEAIVVLVGVPMLLWIWPL